MHIPQASVVILYPASLSSYPYFITLRLASCIPFCFLQLAEAVQKILYAVDAKESALVEAQELISELKDAGIEEEESILE